MAAAAASSATVSAKNDDDDETTMHEDAAKNSDNVVPVTASLLLAVVSAAALLRAAVGFQPHSGQDDYHGAGQQRQQRHGTGTAGARAAYGGDFEAQRHWMELTWQLPVAEWYWHDLEYWGLDYPPLTAYVSWVCGALSSALVGPDSVALTAQSRGYEDPVHKSYMRATVVFLDLACYVSAVLYWTILGGRGGATRRQRNSTTTTTTITALWTMALALMQPAIILIDHGHFQYNTVALGLSLWAFYFMTKTNAAFDNNRDCVLGSVLFCLALSFKQMTLYYAPAVFFYLLGRCFASNKNTTVTLWQATQRVLSLGVTVVVTFAALWWPFVWTGPENTTHAERFAHVLGRIFPFQRGLFEGKVANLWCALSVHPLRLRQRVPVRWQPAAATLLTLALLVPVCYHLFRAGRRAHQTTASIQRRQLLWGATNSALAFFLASFQVHEKSLLLAVAPCSLLLHYDAGFVEWFSLVAAWTLWPLMQIDRLQTAYFCTVSMFGATLRLRREWNDETSVPGTVEFFERRRCGLRSRWIPVLSYAVMVALHVAEWIVVPNRLPSHWPDLFPVLGAIAGCGFCCLAWLVTAWRLFGIDREVTTLLERKEKVA